jgi:hypothetical protein
MYTVTRGAYYFTVELACGGAFSDCPSSSLMPKWFSPKGGPSLYLTIQGAAGCGARPVLSGNSTTFEPLLMLLEPKYFLTLSNVVVDGGSQRPGIYADPAGAGGGFAGRAAS